MSKVVTLGFADMPRVLHYQGLLAMVNIVDDVM
jgi:hypothetical protein